MSKKMTVFKELPKNYQPIDQFDLNENQGLAMILNLTGIGVLFGAGWLLLESLAVLRPEYLLDENILVISGMREFWRGVLLLVVALGLMVLLNALGRAIIFWLMTKTSPRFDFHGIYNVTATSEWYFSRRAYNLIRLLPIIMITIAGLIAIPLVPLNLIPGVLLLISLNLAGGLSDIVTIYWLSRRPENVLVLETNEVVQVFYPGIEANETRQSDA